MLRENLDIYMQKMKLAPILQHSQKLTQNRWNANI